MARVPPAKKGKLLKPLPKIGFYLFLFSFLFCDSGCAPKPISRHQEEINGVFHEVIVVGKTKADRDRLLARSFEMIRRLEEKTSARKPGSEISKINQSAFPNPQQTSPEIFALIEKGIEFFEKSGGAFDITVLPLTKLWAFGTLEPHLPKPEEIQALLPEVGSDQILLDAKKKKVGFRRPHMEIDLSSLSQGYICDELIQFLKAGKATGALVNVGGTIAVFGQSPERKPWRVGIRHPRDPTRTLKVVSLADEALSTRGDYDEFFVINGRRYCNLLNPRTGYPANESVAVSVIAPSALLADALSTSLFVLGPQKAPHLANQYARVRWYLTYFSNGDHFKTLSSEPTA